MNVKLKLTVQYQTSGRIMISRKIFWLFLLLTSIMFCSKKNLKAEGCQEVLTVQGILIVTGNEPFTETILKTLDGNYRLTDDVSAGELRTRFQNQKIEIEGCVVTSRADGLIPRLLGDLKVITYKSLSE